MTTAKKITKYAERKARLGPKKWAARLAVREAGKARRAAAKKEAAS